MEIFLAPLPMVCIFRNLLVLRECVLMLMTSTTDTYFVNAKLLKQGIIKFEKHFLNSTTNSQS